MAGFIVTACVYMSCVARSSVLWNMEQESSTARHSVTQGHCRGCVVTHN
jgi:hypothetical protein